MKLTYKGWRSFGCSTVEIDFKDNEKEKIAKLVEMMRAKGWEKMSVDYRYNYAFCPTYDRNCYEEYWLSDWRECKLALKRRDKK